MRSLILGLLATSLLTACSGSLGSSDGTSSSFGRPDSFGNFNAGLSQTTVPGVRRDADGEGFAFQAGITNSNALSAISGLLPGTDVAAWSGMGTVSYSGSYSAVMITDIFNPPGLIEGTPFTVGSPINLSASFVNNTVTGTSNDGRLTVNGTVNNGDLNGSISFDEVNGFGETNGTLDGIAGSDQIFGVFHGNSDDLVVAGGFIVDQN